MREQFGRMEFKFEGKCALCTPQHWRAESVLVPLAEQWQTNGLNDCRQANIEVAWWKHSKACSRRIGRQKANQSARAVHRKKEDWKNDKDMDAAKKTKEGYCSAAKLRNRKIGNGSVARSCHQSGRRWWKCCIQVKTENWPEQCVMKYGTALLARQTVTSRWLCLQNVNCHICSCRVLQAANKRCLLFSILLEKPLQWASLRHTTHFTTGHTAWNTARKHTLTYALRTAFFEQSFTVD